MYYLVNASPPNPLDVATSNFADALVRSKAGICDGVSSIKVKFRFFFRERCSNVLSLFLSYKL